MAEQTALEHMQERIERFIDTSSLDSVLEIIEGICQGKAEHIWHDWQDDATARAWDMAARVIAKAAKHPAIVNVGR